MKPVILAMAARQMSLANRVASAIDGEVRCYRPRADERASNTFDDVTEVLRDAFASGRPIVAIMAAGIVVRALAPSLADKRLEPPVIVLSEDGAHAVPLLGGHRGANELARQIAGAIEGAAAITTAGDIALGLALDEPPKGYVLASGDAKRAMAAMLDGANVAVDDGLPWAHGLRGPIRADKPTVRLILANEARPEAREGELIYRAEHYALGIGCERGASSAELADLVARTLDEANVPGDAVAVLASIDLKADEAALHELSARMDRPMRFVDAEALAREEHRLETPSEVVRAEIGIAGVAEAAALHAAGPDGALAIPKRKSRRCTVALARAPRPIDARSVGRARGHLAVVGIGPGGTGWRAPAAGDAISAADHAVGYSLYLDLCADLIRGERHDYPLGAEEARVREAIRLAASGASVALVCSGDPGIYAMAALVFEVLDRGDCSPAERRIDVTVVPGISALQGAAARVGAPLGHDFCAISLSDLLTPWNVIERRIAAAGEADFVIAFYNPVSRRRTRQLAIAREILLRSRSRATPVVLASNIARADEAIRVVRLGDLRVEDVDMLTTVIVGSSQTTTMERGDGTVRAYTPRGYAAKAGSGIGAEAVAV